MNDQRYFARVFFEILIMVGPFHLEFKYKRMWVNFEIHDPYIKISE